MRLSLPEIPLYKALKHQARHWDLAPKMAGDGSKESFADVESMFHSDWALETAARTKSGWWFGTFFIFPYIGNNHPNWLIFFRGVGIPPTSHCLELWTDPGLSALASLSTSPKKSSPSGGMHIHHFPDLVEVKNRGSKHIKTGWWFGPFFTFPIQLGIS